MTAPCDYYEEAQRVANIFHCAVGIYPTGSDEGRFRHWDWVAANLDGSLPPNHVDIVYPKVGPQSNE